MVMGARARRCAVTATLLLGCAQLSCGTAHGAWSTRVAWQSAPGATNARPRTLAELARDAVSPDRAVAEGAIARLRAAGPPGLDALFTAHAGAIARLRAAAERAGAVPADAPTARVRTALERVARQRDAHFAGLYWYTDLAAAQRAAAETGRPILSLRLLGDLGEELSCANSRFFRTALYPDARVAAHLRARFVLHWSSERPAPRVTIDYGDGRTVQRTITGNSVHYVLDARGRAIDALPGLYAPAAFLRSLEPAERAARQLGERGDAAAFASELREYHRARLEALTAEWTRVVNVEGGLSPAEAQQVEPPAVVASGGAGGAGAPAAPDAAIAGNIAVGKAAPEMPMVRALRPAGVPAVSGLATPGPAWWQTLIERRAATDALGPASRALMRTKVAPADQRAVAARLAAFERAMAEDTLRNEFGLHRELHAWFVADAARASDRDALNARVYDQLFLTPRTDPWLGLMPANGFAGIEGDGIVAQP